MVVNYSDTTKKEKIMEIDEKRLAEVIKKTVSETIDEKNQDLVQKIRIFVEMSLNKIIDAKMKQLLAQLKGEDGAEILGADSEHNLDSVLSRLLSEIGTINDTCSEILDNMEGIYLRMDEP